MGFVVACFVWCFNLVLLCICLGGRLVWWVCIGLVIGVMAVCRLFGVVFLRFLIWLFITRLVGFCCWWVCCLFIGLLLHDIVLRCCLVVFVFVFCYLVWFRMLDGVFGYFYGLIVLVVGLCGFCLFVLDLMIVGFVVLDWMVCVWCLVCGCLVGLGGWVGFVV